MLVVQGYYDKGVIKPLEKLVAKPKQKVLITVLDEIVEPQKTKKKSLRGVLAKYANPNLTELEKDAWQKAVLKKYSDRK